MMQVPLVAFAAVTQRHTASAIPLLTQTTASPAYTSDARSAAENSSQVPFNATLHAVAN
jgi:hypothetical protein